MTGAKHTPGPWALLVDGFIHAKDGGRVADPSPWSPLHKQRSAEEIAANTHLIAAAPELLEAATAARDALASAIRAAWEGGDADVSEHIVIKKIDAAIAKAVGGES